MPQDTYGVEVEAQVLAEHVELPRRHWWLWRQAGRWRDAAVGPAGQEEGTSSKGAFTSRIVEFFQRWFSDAFAPFFGFSAPI